MAVSADPPPFRDPGGLSPPVPAVDSSTHCGAGPCYSAFGGLPSALSRPAQYLTVQKFIPQLAVE